MTKNGNYESTSHLMRCIPCMGAFIDQPIFDHNALSSPYMEL